MPRRYRPKKKQPARRKFRRRRKTPMPGRIMPGFPANKVVKMRYVDTVTLNPTLAAMATHVFSANSIFDPDVTGGGHQPLGHDEWSLFYNHVTILGSKITVQFIYSATNANSVYMEGIYLSDDTVTPTTGPAIAEQGLGKFRLNAAVNYTPQTRKMTNTFSAKRFFNRTDVKDVDSLQATFGTHPTERAYFTVWAYDSSGADIGNIAALVTIEYIVSMSEPKSLAQS